MWDKLNYSGKLVSTNRNLVNEVFMQSSECLKPYLFEPHYFFKLQYIQLFIILNGMIY